MLPATCMFPPLVPTVSPSSFTLVLSKAVSPSSFTLVLSMAVSPSSFTLVLLMAVSPSSFTLVLSKAVSLSSFTLVLSKTGSPSSFTLVQSRAGGVRKIDSIEELWFSQSDNLSGSSPWPSRKQAGSSWQYDSHWSMLLVEAQASCA